VGTNIILPDVPVWEDDDGATWHSYPKRICSCWKGHWMNLHCNCLLLEIHLSLASELWRHVRHFCPKSLLGLSPRLTEDEQCIVPATANLVRVLDRLCENWNARVVSHPFHNRERNPACQMSLPLLMKQNPFWKSGKNGRIDWLLTRNDFIQTCWACTMFVSFWPVQMTWRVPFFHSC
jgi:hypothetical protein